ncbi:MAG TPA: HAD family phosphatase [Candidatus Saccharimonadales bacterium]|nr:HAD family phosphatase [Candidatus Saccharimonadales bacterium]
MYKAVIFDFFNVIHRDPFLHWLKQNGLERSGALHESSRRVDLGEISDKQFMQELSDLSGQPLADVTAAFQDTSFIDADVVALIKQLKRHYKTGLLSNSSIEYLAQIMARHELESLFDVITVSAEVRLIKPDPRIFEHALRQLDVSADEAVFIDDNPRNVAAAARLGIKGITYTDISSLKRALSEAGVAT